MKTTIILLTILVWGSGCKDHSSEARDARIALLQQRVDSLQTNLFNLQYLEDEHAKLLATQGRTINGLSNALEGKFKSDYDRTIAESPIKGVHLELYNAIERLAVATYPNNEISRRNMINQQIVEWLSQHPEK